MTREECEKQMLQCFEKAIEIYHQYNPEGRIFSASYTDGRICLFNDWYLDGNTDQAHPISVYGGEWA